MITELTTRDKIEIHTPDGWQQVGTFFDKGTEGGVMLFYIKEGENVLYSIKASLSHLFQMEDNNWVEAGNIIPGDRLLIDGGTAIIEQMSFIGEIPIYDIEVLHPNHRYFSNKLVSHNSGKTTICLQSCVQAQRSKQIGIFIDLEQTFDTVYAQSLGLVLDNKTFAVFQPMNAEEAETIIDLAYKELERIDYIIIDSIAAMQPKAKMEAQDSTGTGMQKALHASFMSNWIPKFNAQIKKGNTSVLFTNQLRAAPSIGGGFQAKAVGDGAGIGSGFSQDTSWVTTGGHAIRFYMSQRYLLMWRKRFKEIVEDENGDTEETDTGNLIRIRNVKNKVSIPYKDESFVIVFGKGTVDYYPVFDALTNWGYITSSGSKFTFEDPESGVTYSANGKFNFFKIFRETENWELAKEIYLDEIKAADEEMIANLQLGSEDKASVVKQTSKSGSKKSSGSSKVEIED